MSSYLPCWAFSLLYERVLTSPRPAKTSPPMSTFTQSSSFCWSVLERVGVWVSLTALFSGRQADMTHTAVSVTSRNTLQAPAALPLSSPCSQLCFWMEPVVCWLCWHAYVVFCFFVFLPTATSVTIATVLGDLWLIFVSLCNICQGCCENAPELIWLDVKIHRTVCLNVNVDKKLCFVCGELDQY